MAPQEKIPSGSRGPQPEDPKPQDAAGGQPKPTEEPKPEDKGGEGEGTAPDKFAGKSEDELKSAYQNLEKKFGDQGRELGELRQAMAGLQQAQQSTQPAEPGYEEQLQGIIAKVDDGEIDYGEALRQAMQIGSQQTETMVAQKYEEFDQQRQAKEQYNRFLSDHPDFVEARDSGVLERYKADNPMHDNVSAYYAYKADQRAKEEYERGKTEAQKLEEGQEDTTKVVSSTGADAHQAQQRTGPVSEAERKQRMLNRLKQTREGST